VRADGGFYFKRADGSRFNFTQKHATLLQRGDGWLYEQHPVPDKL